MLFFGHIFLNVKDGVRLDLVINLNTRRNIENMFVRSKKLYNLLNTLNKPMKVLLILCIP